MKIIVGIYFVSVAFLSLIAVAPISVHTSISKILITVSY